MTAAKPTLKTCKKGHKFYKSSGCPICPACEKERKPKDSFLSLLGAPARRALENEGITALEQLSAYTEKDILALHGIGKSTIPKLNEALIKAGLSFKKPNSLPQKKTRETDSLITKYHASGKTIWSKGRHINGQPEGYWEWYRIDGTLKRSGHFENGEPVGEWITYDKEGKKYKVTNKK